MGKGEGEKQSEGDEGHARPPGGMACGFVVLVRPDGNSDSWFLPVGNTLQYYYTCTVQYCALYSRAKRCGIRYSMRYT